MKYYVGLDVSMQKTFVCILDGNGKIFHEDCVKTDPILIANFLNDMKLKNIELAFESGSLSHYLMSGFKEKNIQAICMDARKLNHILNLKVNKTDKNDARGIAEALRSNLYTEVGSSTWSKKDVDQPTNTIKKFYSRVVKKLWSKTRICERKKLFFYSDEKYRKIS